MYIFSEKSNLIWCGVLLIINTVVSYDTETFVSVQETKKTHY